jgi:hypothetical protein
MWDKWVKNNSEIKAREKKKWGKNKFGNYRAAKKKCGTRG